MTSDQEKPGQRDLANKIPPVHAGPPEYRTNASGMCMTCGVKPDDPGHDAEHAKRLEHDEAADTGSGMPVYEVTLKVYMRADSQQTAEDVGDHFVHQIESQPGIEMVRNHGVMTDEPEDPADFPE